MEAKHQAFAFSNLSDAVVVSIAPLDDTGNTGLQMKLHSRKARNQMIKKCLWLPSTTFCNISEIPQLKKMTPALLIGHQIPHRIMLQVTRKLLQNNCHC
jgi:hypothetical protein